MDIIEFKRRLREKMLENRRAFEGGYKDQINELMGLSKTEIDSITPDSTDLEIYDQLITVVKEASSVNLGQANLKEGIVELGEVAVKIAGKIPWLAAILNCQTYSKGFRQTLELLFLSERTPIFRRL